MGWTPRRREPARATAGAAEEGENGEAAAGSGDVGLTGFGCVGGFSVVARPGHGREN
jgi:hypothetical protein